MLILLLAVFVAILAPTWAIVDKYDSDWDLNFPCRTDIEKLAKAHSKMADCATSFSAPPAVCSNCFMEYIALRHAEYRTHHLNDLFSIDNQTCSTVIYSNYVLSYSDVLTKSMSYLIWDNSRCSACLYINWDFVNQNSTVRFDEKTAKFQTLLLDWRACVENATAHGLQLCDACGTSFNTLFDFYWRIYTQPDIEFCIDVESTMNDTMNIWHNVWACPDDPRPANRHNDMVVVVFSTTLLVIVIALFYASAYIQTENAHINLIQYSQLAQPSTTRYRLMSSSNLQNASGFLTPGSSSLFGSDPNFYG